MLPDLVISIISYRYILSTRLYTLILKSIPFTLCFVVMCRIMGENGKRMVLGMGIKSFETRSSLKQKLHNRNLSFNDKELDEILASHNYFNFFNGLETIFLESSQPKTYDNIKLNDFMILYKFDKEIRSILSTCLDSVEEKLKASISYHFSKRHCTTLNDTMQYTNKINYMDPANNIPGTPTYCKYSNTYPFKNEQNYKIYQDFNGFKLFKEKFFADTIKKNDHLDTSFYQDNSYSAPSGVIEYRDNRHNIYMPKVAIPFWVIIETLTFGELLYLLHYLQDDVMEDVLKDFGLPISKRTQFLNMIDILVCLRNKCAHTTLINRFRTDRKYKINALLISAFSLNPKNNNPSCILKLYDTIKILSYFTDVSALKKPFKVLKYRIYTSLGVKKGKYIYNKILDRMGCGDSKQWREVLSNIKYSL